MKTIDADALKAEIGGLKAQAEDSAEKLAQHQDYERALRYKAYAECLNLIDRIIDDMPRK